MEGDKNMIKKIYNRNLAFDFFNKCPIINLNAIGFLENETDAEIFTDDEEKPTGVIAKKGYFSYIYTENDDFLNEALCTLYKNGEYGFSGVYRPLAEKIKKKFQVEWESNCALYYYAKRESDLSQIKSSVESVKIEDAGVIDHFYTYRNETSLQRIKEDILKRPSSAIYKNGEIASWVLVHNDNSMGIMYTKDKFRKLGYAVDVTIDLQNKILKSGKTPFLQINEANNMSPGLAKKCGFVHEDLYSDWFGIDTNIKK